MMKSYGFWMCVAVILFGACRSAEKYEISGRFEGLSDKIVMTVGDEAINESTLRPDGSFTLRGKWERPEAIRLADRHGTPILSLLLQPGTTVVTGDLENLPETITVSGTPLNERLMALSHTVAELRFRCDMAAAGSEQSRFELAYDSLLAVSFGDHRNDILGAFIFATWMCEHMDTDELTLTLEAFPAEIAAAKILNRPREILASRLRTAEGSPYTEVILPDEGRFDAKLSAVVRARRYVLLHFWATWSPHCMEKLPALIRVYREYQREGLEIYAVSMDSSRETWLTAIRDYRLQWINVGSFGGVANEAVSDYDIGTLPMNYLISHEGVIVAKGLQPEELAAFLAGVAD